METEIQTLEQVPIEPHAVPLAPAAIVVQWAFRLSGPILWTVTEFHSVESALEYLKKDRDAIPGVLRIFRIPAEERQQNGENQEA